jgi:hypothetical protein
MTRIETILDALEEAKAFVVAHPEADKAKRDHKYVVRLIDALAKRHLLITDEATVQPTATGKHGPCVPQKVIANALDELRKPEGVIDSLLPASVYGSSAQPVDREHVREDLEEWIAYWLLEGPSE